MEKKKFHFRRVIRGFVSLTLSGVLTISGFAGSTTVFAEKTVRETYLGYLDELTPLYLKNLPYARKNSEFVDKTTGEYSSGEDFVIDPFEVGDTPQVINKKILEQNLENKEMPHYNNFPYGGSTNDNVLPFTKVPIITGQSIAKAWAEMLAIAERGDFAADQDFIQGLYCTKLQYGDDPIAAFTSAVENNEFLTDKNKPEDITQVTSISGPREKYIKAAVKYGNGNTIFNDIKERYKDNDSSCYCMVVINNMRQMSETTYPDAPNFIKKLQADYSSYGTVEAGKGGKRNYFGRPWIYVLFFHDFGAENREGEYTVKLTGNETAKELEALGIKCEAKDVKSNISYENKDESGNADLYAAENNTGSTATVTTSIAVEEGSSKSITQQCEYSKAFSNETSATASMTYKMEVSALGVTMGTEMGFSATDTAAWSWTSTKMDGTEESTSNVETHSKEFALDMPPYTKSTIIAQPTKSTISHEYNTTVTPTYKVDVLLYDPYFEAPFSYVAQETSVLASYIDEKPMAANLTNPNGYKDLTVDDLFKTAVVDWGHYKNHPTDRLKWTEDIVDRGDSEAALILGGLYFDRPILPSGGKFSYTKKGVRITASEFEPSLPLSLIKPSVTEINVNEGGTASLEDLDVEGFNYMGGVFYGFNKNTSGEWQVKEGSEDYIEIGKNSAGNLEVKGKKEGTAVIWYVPTNVDSEKLSQDIEIKGITVNVGAKGSDDPGNKGEEEKEKAQEKAAENAVEKGLGSVEDTVVLPSGSGKKLKLTFEGTPSQNSVLTVAKGNRFQIDGDFSDFKSDSDKVKVTKAGKVTAKNATGNTPANITFKSVSDGVAYTLSVYVLDPADTNSMEIVSGNSVKIKKMKINADTSDQVVDISLKGVPLNAVVDTPVDKKGSTEPLPGNSSIFAVGSDGHYHIKAGLKSKGKVKIPLKINGKKFMYVMKIKEAK